jgi:hypothetical protein
MAKKATKTAAKKTQVTKRGDQAPESKSSPAEASRAAQKMFDDADASVLTEEQQMNQLRNKALGY